MKVQRLIALTIALLLMGASAWAGAPKVPAPHNPPTAEDVDAMVDYIDRLFRSDTSTARMQMSITTPDWQRTLSMSIWTEGLHKTFVHIDAPKKDSGITTLRIGNEMWNYFPKIDRVMKVPPSMMMSSWMGSDFTNDDLVKESSMKRDYTASLILPEKAEPGYWYVELHPRENTPIVWGKIVAAVRKSDLIPVRQEYYDERGTLVRIMEMGEIKPLGGRLLPTLLVLTPISKPGNRTEVRYLEAVFDRPLPEGVFTLRNLQRPQ